MIDYKQKICSISAPGFIWDKADPLPIIEAARAFNPSMPDCTRLVIGQFIDLPKAAVGYYSTKYGKHGKELIKKIIQLARAKPSKGFFGEAITEKTAIYANVMGLCWKIVSESEIFPVMVFPFGLVVDGVEPGTLKKNMEASCAKFGLNVEIEVKELL